jgi:DNA helicase-2/ATP-dependent DNA helicase PcrA
MLLLAGSHHNIYAVGDEDQSIYPGAGQTSATSLSSKDFPKPRLLPEQNYRSTQNILPGRFSGGCEQPQTQGQESLDLAPGRYEDRLLQGSDGENEALRSRYIAKYLREAVDQGENARAAVLYRTNSQSRLYEEAMRRYGLKYHVVGGFSFYERAEIKDMISYLKVIHNPDDSIALLRVINTPVRGIGKTSIETVERVALETGLSLWGAIAEAIKRQLLPQRALAALKGFTGLIEDGRAILGWNVRERLAETAREQAEDEVVWPRATRPRETDDGALEASADDDTDFSPDNFSLISIPGRG